MADPADALLAWARARAQALIDELPASSPLRTLLPYDEPPVEPELGEATGVAVVDGAVHLRLPCPSWDAFLERLAEDLQRGRVFVPCSRAPALRAAVVLRIELPAPAKDLALVGTVVHEGQHRGRAGVGVELEKLRPHEREQLRSVIRGAQRRTWYEEVSPSGSATPSSTCLKLYAVPDDPPKRRHKPPKPVRPQTYVAPPPPTEPVRAERSRPLVLSRRRPTPLPCSRTPLPPPPPESTEDLIDAARRLIRRKQYLQARVTLRRGVPGRSLQEQTRLRAWILYTEARVLAAKGDVEGAVGKYEGAVELDSSCDEAARELLIARCLLDAEASGGRAR